VNNDSSPVFIADSCIGGLSVVKSLWNAGVAGNAMFLADYAINPLGVKSDDAIADVTDAWLGRAAEASDTLVIACNTLAIKYYRLRRSALVAPGRLQVVSLVDCFVAMARAEAERLAGKDVLIIGTEFTTRQRLYSDILRLAVPDSNVDAIAATELERKIARFEMSDEREELSLDDELCDAVENTDFAILACTCFPMVKRELEAQFPNVVFLDPGEYCSGMVKKMAEASGYNLSVMVSGDVVTADRVVDYAKSYLGDCTVHSVEI